MHTCRISLRVFLHFVGAEALYLMVCVFQTNSLGSRREREGSLAEKALLSSIFGKLTQKTLARVSNLFFGEDVPGVGTLANMISQLAQLSHWRDARSPASPGTTCGNRESGWNAFTFQEKPISMIKTFNT